MKRTVQSILRSKLRGDNYGKLVRLQNAKLNELLADAITLCEPESVFVCSDSEEEVRFIREQAVAIGEEKPLKIPGHTVHFDGPSDQGRDREVTKYLVPKSGFLGKALKQLDRDKGLAEIRGLLKGSMKGRTMIVRLLSLGPTGSVFSIPCAQFTDSFYVAHSEDLLYRPAYDHFLRTHGEGEFFCILHSSGPMDERKVSVDADHKRIYIDYTADMIYTVNTQYAGNSIGLKKLALRLTIRKADREGWLAEHMFLMGVHGPNGRKTYISGAFPSACGKTSTAMLQGETILGDDIAYLRNINAEARAVNAERGIFGIVQNVNPVDDPAIYRALTNPGEVVFSNVLVADGRPYWLGMGCELPKAGENFTGAWHAGKTDAQGSPVPPAHKNARYAISLHALENADPQLDNPSGVVVHGIMYGRRDARASMPVQQGFDWAHGICAYGAWLETETTFATVGKEGVPEINIMSIQDFVAIPLGKYIANNLEFGRRLKKPPLVFGVNYFLRDKDGQFVNAVRDKAVWVKWMELRVHGEAGAVRTATGLIPQFADLQRLFRQVLGKEYAKEDYVRQFSLRVKENLSKLERVEKFYHTEVLETPPALMDILHEQRRRLLETQERLGDWVSPFDLPESK